MLEQYLMSYNYNVYQNWVQSNLKKEYALYHLMVLLSTKFQSDLMKTVGTNRKQGNKVKSEKLLKSEINQNLV